MISCDSPVHIIVREPFLGTGGHLNKGSIAYYKKISSYYGLKYAAIQMRMDGWNLDVARMVLLKTKGGGLN